ncbi:peptidoglycan D,D-transpeptidase FtsI family protein [Campylobacter portucalensis]|nr:penicillin-binding protein 2 [Campylobacter portucalensis]
MNNLFSNLRRYFLFYFLPFVIMGIFLLAAYFQSISHKKSTKLEISEKTSALRGSIITKDGFIVANSQKLYKAVIDTRSIDPDKLDLFIKLYCIYTNDNEKKVKNLITSRKGTVVLSYKIDPKTAMHLKKLSRYLTKKKVFISFITDDNVVRQPIALDILESGENRKYIAKDSLSPILGYIKKIEKDKITKTTGVKGVEKYYNQYLFANQDEFIKGYRDIGNTIILDKGSIKSLKIDGYDAILNIPLKFQIKLESLLTKKAKQYGAKEIIVGVMDSKTSKILALATSNRYNPENILKSNYSALNSTAIEYPYEAGSVIKPIIFSIAYENKKLNLNEMIPTYNGTYKLGNSIIKDTHPSSQMNLTDIIVHSSNIGMIMIISRLDNLTLYEGLDKFNLSKKTGIDLPYEHSGILPTINMLKNQSYKATLSYGYGIQTTFMQILNAFCVFNNNGIMTQPRIVSHLHKNGKFYVVDKPQQTQVISQNTANIMKNILIQAVERGTGKKGQINGLEIGGKTGTARMAKNGTYIKAYNSSFFGFANDKNSSFTIGVLVREPTIGSYYAAQNALPIFKEVVEMLVDEGYLIKFQDKNQKILSNENLDEIKD